MRVRRFRSIAVAVGVVLTATFAVGGAAPPAARGQTGMVVAPEPRATEVGAAILREGGNAVDAAVATAFALAVSLPQAGNLGGGGFLLVRDVEGAYHALDFRETAPGALTAEAFLDDEGRAQRDLSQRGGLAVGVPGSVAGLHEVHRRFGALPWARVIAPAVRLARDGVTLSRRSAARFEEATPDFLLDPEARRIFTRDGRALREGDRLVQPELAATLETIARKGPRGFYAGRVAEAVTRSVAGRGGVMRPDDLDAYRPVWRDPLEGRYRGHRIVTFPPPSSGGVAVLQVLGMLEPADVAGHGPGASWTLHRMVEAFRRAFADRARWLGDPDHVDVPVDRLLDPRHIAGLAASIRDDRATPSDDLPEIVAGPPEGPDTLHLSVVDSAGRAVALTTTLNSSFGARFVAPGTGVLLNNEIDDFALAPGVPDQFGLVGTGANAVGPRKRPVSSMTPTMVEDPDGRLRWVLGAPGGSRIITAVAQVIVNVIDHGMELQRAVNAPRVHHQWLPDELYAEEDAVPEDVRVALEARGHRVVPYGRPAARIHAVGRDEDGTWLGAADPRGQGTAEAP